MSGNGAMAARKLILVGILVALTGCGAANPELMNINQPSAEGPDEFSVLPTKPLEMPEDFAALPSPTPGGNNRTDVSPESDVAIALGGNPGVLNRPGGDPALIRHTTRYGVQSGIRSTLAASDLEFRRDNDGRLLERLFNVNVYYRAYEEMSLDQYAELERMRRAGIRTSAVPPNPAGE